jgi:hypothetical protein
MPDLVTHSFAAWLLVRPERWRKIRLLFFLGTFLPDIVSRPIYILFPQLNGYSLAMHTPIFIFLCGLLAAEFMAPNLRHGARLAVSAGIILHFALDVMQRHLGSGYYWLFPFSWKSYELAWYWPEQTIRWVPLWFGLMLSGEIYLYLRQKRPAHQRKS